MGINKVFLSGNLTRDPELRATPGGEPVLEFGLAVNDRVRDSSGEWVDRPNFVDCTVWGRRAEALAKILTKGFKVCVEGSLRYSSWEDRETGQRRSKLRVTAREVELMGRGQQQQQPDAAQAVQGAYPGATVEAYDDSDIPF